MFFESFFSQLILESKPDLENNLQDNNCLKPWLHCPRGKQAEDNGKPWPLQLLFAAVSDSVSVTSKMKCARTNAYINKIINMKC